MVAELSGNHLGQLDRAIALVNAAADAGADAIKIQTFNPEQMTEPHVVVETGPWAGHNLMDLYRQTMWPRDWHAPIFDAAAKRGMIAFSSVFHPDDVDFLETLGCPIYKIASFELTDLTLIKHVASKGKDMILSTGMATKDEIMWAMISTLALPRRKVTLLKCTSAYPALTRDANLATMPNMAVEFDVEVGLSDHTIGNTCAVVATVLGASVIEKHLTLDRSEGGPDSAFSAEPLEFAAMVQACKNAATAIGSVRYGPTTHEAPQFVLRRTPGGKRGIS